LATDTTIVIIGHMRIAAVALLCAAGLLAGSAQASSGGQRRTTSARATGNQFEIQFAGHGRRELDAPPVARPLVRGRLIVAGRGVARALVILTQQVPGEGSQTVATVSTNRRGFFAVRLPPGGSRRVIAFSRGMTSNVLVEREAVWIQLAASPRVVAAGQSVRFFGWLPNARGVRLIVALEVMRAGGYQWFDTVRSDMNGHFSGSFPLTVSGANYRFRADVPAQVGLSLAPAASDGINVSVL
jgi:hypothetical protein